VLSVVGIHGTREALNITQWVFRYISPHYCLVKGLSDLQSAYNRAHKPGGFPGVGGGAMATLGGDSGGGGDDEAGDEAAAFSPFALDVTGHHCIAMAVQTVVFFACVFAVEHSLLHRVRQCAARLLRPGRRQRYLAVTTRDAAAAGAGTRAEVTTLTYPS
jgi:hypothetical protein